jgi:hypothetical protein
VTLFPLPFPSTKFPVLLMYANKNTKKCAVELHFKYQKSWISLCKLESKVQTKFISRRPKLVIGCGQGGNCCGEIMFHNTNVHEIEFVKLLPSGQVQIQREWFLLFRNPQTL